MVTYDERRLYRAESRPLDAWRIFRARRDTFGWALSAPLVHDPGFEVFPSRTIEATCYQHDHPAPAPRCRCGLYAVVDGTKDSLTGYLLDSAHDRAPVVYAEVACSGTIYLDVRGVRAQRLRIIRLVAPGPLPADLLADLESRYALRVEHSAALPPWLIDAPQGAPPAGITIDLDELVTRLEQAPSPSRP